MTESSSSKDTMKAPSRAGSVIWQPGHRVRSFAYPQSPNSASFVFELISEAAFVESENKGLSYTIEQVIDFRANLHGELTSMQVFGDLKLKREFLAQAPDFEVSLDPVLTYLDRALETRWFLADGDELHLAFGSLAPERWLQIGNNSLWIGLRDGCLAALVAGDVQRDDLGEKQSAWEKSCMH